MRFARSDCAVSESESSTPHSLIRLPNIRKPIRATAFGATSPVRIVTKIGNMILAVFDTFPAVYSIRILRSFFVVRSLMIGGCTIGTRAMYEYAATMMAPIYFVPK